MVLIVEQTEDCRESSTVGKASRNGNRGIHNCNQILLGFSGSRKATEVVAGGCGGDREGGCDRYKNEDFV